MAAGCVLRKEGIGPLRLAGVAWYITSLRDGSNERSSHGYIGDVHRRDAGDPGRRDTSVQDELVSSGATEQRVVRRTATRCSIG